MPLGEVVNVGYRTISSYPHGIFNSTLKASNSREAATHRVEANSSIRPRINRQFGGIYEKYVFMVLSFQLRRGGGEVVDEWA
jgi:hypothetical protein